MSNTEMSRNDRTTASDYRRTMARLSWWQAIAAGAVAAAILNLVIFFIGAATGASFVVHQGSTTALTVIIFTVLPLVVGTGLATLLARRWCWMIRLAQVIGAGLALLTMVDPALADTDNATRVALSLMHVVVAVAVIAILEAIRQRAQTSH
ncbi:MAG: DUF6069 family protein [Pseudonocardiaceae bacterium]